MALGNANSSAQSRGKNKPVIVRRTKEIFNAKDYNAVNGSPSAPGAADACALADMSNTYYHDGTGTLPVNGDFVFSIKRAHEQFWLPNGTYKMQAGGSTNMAITVTNGRVSATQGCK
tara:strand:+ start:403 stop:753 length:351 start_codon:yes stop_codon:yes gene_type:complete